MSACKRKTDRRVAPHAVSWLHRKLYEVGEELHRLPPGSNGNLRKALDEVINTLHKETPQRERRRKRRREADRG